MAFLFGVTSHWRFGREGGATPLLVPKVLNFVRFACLVGFFYLEILTKNGHTRGRRPILDPSMPTYIDCIYLNIFLLDRMLEMWLCLKLLHFILVTNQQNYTQIFTPN